MNILLVYSCLPIGGIETFFVRLVKCFHKKNIKVNVIFYANNFNKELYSELEKYSTIYHWNDYSYAPVFIDKFPPFLKLLFPLKKNKIKNQFLNDITHIHAPETTSLVFSQKLFKLNEKVVITTGVYQANEFDYSNYLNCYFGKYYKILINSLYEYNMFVFNEALLEKNKILYNKFYKNEVITFGIELEKYLKTISGKKNNIITSIGRLVSWKSYNKNIIQTIIEFNRKNVKLIYKCFGDGEERENLESLVKSNNLEKQVFFYPSVQHVEFKNTIQNSLLFIGSGTALIEASACGIPALIGIENLDSDVSYGFMHNVNSNTFHEKDLLLPKNKYSYFINYLLNLSENEYDLECVKAQTKAKDFDINITVEQFLNALQNSKVGFVKFNFFSFCLLLISLAWHAFYFKFFNRNKRSFFQRL